MQLDLLQLWNPVLFIILEEKITLKGLLLRLINSYGHTELSAGSEKAVAHSCVYAGCYSLGVLLIARPIFPKGIV